MSETEGKLRWDEQKGELKKKFAALTDNDLIFEEGEKQEMFERLLLKAGKTREELRKIIGEL